MEQGKDASFFSKFMVLRGAVRELWLMFILKIFAILAYALMNSTLVLWLSSDLGFNDANAGYIIAIWSTVMTLFVIMVGSLVDAIGLRKAFLLGFVFCVFSRGVMTFTTIHWFALVFGLLPLAIGEALMVPVMVAAIKRYSTTSQRSLSFSIFYAMMNVGFAISGLIFDRVRSGLGEYGHYTVPLLGMTLSAYRTLFLLSFLFSLPGLIIMYFGLRDGVEATDQGVVITPEQPKYTRESILKALWLMCRDALRDTMRIFAGLWSQPAFYKFLAFLTLVVGVRLIFYHMHYTYPKFGIRELGEGAPIGKLWALNPVLIIFLVPIIGALTQKIPAYRAVTIGSLIAALSVFLLAIPQPFLEPLAQGWLGHMIAHVWLGVQGTVNVYYVSLFFFIVLISVGEAFYSPRLYEYPAAIAPKGQEASYMSLSYLPFFVAKFFVGMISGLLLNTYCPAQGPRASHILWLIIGLMALTTPVGLIALRRFIRVHEAGRDDK